MVGVGEAGHERRNELFPGFFFFLNGLYSRNYFSCRKMRLQYTTVVNHKYYLDFDIQYVLHNNMSLVLR